MAHTSPTIQKAAYQAPSLLTMHSLFVDAVFAFLIAFLALCHLEPHWISTNLSFPYTYQLAWNFSAPAFDFQVLTYELFHLCFWNDLCHILALTTEFLLWLMIVYGTFGMHGLALINVVLAVQAISCHDVWFAACLITIDFAYSVGSVMAIRCAPTSLPVIDIAKILLFWLVMLRTAGHGFEPLPPRYDHSIQQFEDGFGALAFSLLWTQPFRAVWLITLGTVSELGAGMPGRYFNVVVYRFMHACGYRSQTLLAPDEARQQARIVIEKGWAANETTMKLYTWALPTDPGFEKELKSCL